MVRLPFSRALFNHIPGMLPSILQAQHIYRCKVGVEVMHSEAIGDHLLTPTRTYLPLHTLLHF